MRALLVFSAVLLAVFGAPGGPFECKNGGVRPNPAEEKCDCQPYWGGDDCSERLCANGGWLDGKYCHCPRGYYGIHCDAVKQARPVDGVFNTKKSFNLYIHNELTDWYGMSALARIQRDIPNILPNYTFDTYNLFESKRDESVDLVVTPGDQVEFLKSLNDLIPKRTGKYTCEDTNISYEKILSALKKNKIEDSVILMFTQYPPKKDPENLVALKKYLRAFRIKLNVVIGSDDILLDCNSKKYKGAFDELTSLVHYTDGEISSFLVEDDKDVNELLPAFIRASASPQSHAREVSTTCQDAELTFQTDPYPNTYYIAVRSTENNPASISGSCSSGGIVSDPIPSYYGEFTLFSILSGAQQTCTLSVTTATECTATVYSVGGEKDVDNFEIFHSFATSDDMDTDSISAFQEEEFFLTMHIDVPVNSKYKIVRFEGTVNVKNEDFQDVLLTNLDRRSSTYDYQSHDAFICPKNGSTWIQLDLQGFNNIDGNPAVAKLNRMIPVNCEARTMEKDPSKLFRMMDAASNPKPTFALMYSNFLPTSQANLHKRFSRFILEGVNDKVMKEKFSEYGYLRFNAKEIIEDFAPTTNFDDFKRSVYDNAPDSSLTYLDTLNSNIQKLTATARTKVTSESLVSIAIERSMKGVNVVYPSNLAELANLGARLLFWGDVSTVTVDEDSLESLEEYTRIAAVSAGHVVLMDMDDFTEDPDENGDYPYYVSLALRDLYSNGPSQRLLSFSNLEWNQNISTTTQSKPIGTLQAPASTTEVFVSLTLNVIDTVNVVPPFMLSIVLEGSSDRIALNLGDFKQYGTEGYVRSNLYTTTIKVKGGESYDGSFTLLAQTPFTGAHIRFWTARDEDEVIPVLTYADFDKTKTIQPDNFLGAALRVDGTEGEEISLRFLDENGLDAPLLDQNQTVTVVNGVAHFVPYFCDAAQSTSLSNGLYTVEITYDSGNKYLRPMLCSNSTSVPIKDCSKGTDGNFYCTVTNPPFLRGPSKKLVDCSGVGQVEYSEGPNNVNFYECNCESGFTGQSCEQSSCAIGMEHLPEESDVTFRTLSYVLISPPGDDSCSSLAMFYANEAKMLFTQGSSYDNIWQYTFSVYFTDGTARTLYRGPSFNDFYGKFDIFTKLDEDQLETFCGNGKNERPNLDLNEVFNLAVESVGRNSRGVVLLQAIQTFADLDDKNNVLLKSFASDDLYQSIQAYQQHIYMVTPMMIPDFISMTTASGGFAVRITDDYGNFDNAIQKYRDVFARLFTSRIGWAGISTEDISFESTTSAESTAAPVEITRKWIINQNAEIFVTSRNKQGEIPTMTDVPLEPVSDDPDDYGTGATSQHAIISANGAHPLAITITFAAGEEFDLIQIVILTLVDPIQNALLGQNQANMDKHAAGATNSSEKAAHISFNKEAKLYEFSPKDTHWRQAARNNCTFAQEFVASNQPFEENGVGAAVVEFTVKPKATDDPSFSLAVPLAVSNIIDCVNGHFDEKGSYCVCDGPLEDSNWSGPTCSQPACQNGGILNSHGDHCDCSQTEYGGRFCEQKASVDGE